MIAYIIILAKWALAVAKLFHNPLNGYINFHLAGNIKLKCRTLHTSLLRVLRFIISALVTFSDVNYCLFVQDFSFPISF